MTPKRPYRYDYKYATVDPMLPMPQRIGLRISNTWKGSFSYLLDIIMMR